MSMRYLPSTSPKRGGISGDLVLLVVMLRSVAAVVSITIEIQFKVGYVSVTKVVAGRKPKNDCKQGVNGCHEF